MLGLFVQRHKVLPGLSGPTLAGKGEVDSKAVLNGAHDLGLTGKSAIRYLITLLRPREINFSRGLVYDRLCVPTKGHYYEHARCNGSHYLHRIYL